MLGGAYENGASVCLSAARLDAALGLAGLGPHVSALLLSLIPALRAAATDPIKALREA